MTFFGKTWLFAAMLLLSTAAVADDESAKTDPIKTIKQEYAAADADYRAAAAKLGDDEKAAKEIARLDNTLLKRRANCYAKALELAKTDPKSDVGFAALEWLLTSPQCYVSPSAIPAIELMSESHATNPKVGRAAATIGYFCPSEPPKARLAAVAFLEAVAAKNPDRTAKGQAKLGLAFQAAGDHYEAELKRDPEEDRLAARAESALKDVIKDYGDCRTLRTLGATPGIVTVGDEAKFYLNELTNLRLGKHPPDIEGEDIEGAKLKLSDYRGKVVLLVFWSSWCVPCMADVPHEQELFKQFKGRPFVLIGVNGDGMREDAKKAVQQKNISWRSFWNGEAGGDGPIAQAWNVVGWPRLFVIDHEGVLREKNLRGKDLDEPLEKLIVAAEKAMKPK